VQSEYHVTSTEPLYFVRLLVLRVAAAKLERALAWQVQPPTVRPDWVKPPPRPPYPALRVTTEGSTMIVRPYWPPLVASAPRVHRPTRARRAVRRFRASARHRARAPARPSDDPPRRPKPLARLLRLLGSAR
jgi:hypothetical protein